MENAVVERRSTAETELDLPTETLGKIIEIIQTILSTNIIVIIEMDVIITDTELLEISPDCLSSIVGVENSTPFTELDQALDVPGKILLLHSNRIITSACYIERDVLESSC